MKKYICLRDDDTCFNTSVEELKKAYGKIIGEIPITLGVIPFVHGSLDVMNSFDDNKIPQLIEYKNKASADDLTKFYTTHPVGANKELVSFLMPYIKGGKIEIAQHGFGHGYNERGPELFSNEIGFEALRDGKQYLEKVFETKVETFIPPSNTIDVTCVSYLRRLGFKLFSSGTIVKDNTTIPTHDIRSMLRSIQRRIERKKPLPMKKNYGIYQFRSYTLNSFDDPDAILQKVIKELKESGFSAIGSHYTCFVDNNYQKKYYELLETICEMEDVVFVTAREYASLIANKFKLK